MCATQARQGNSSERFALSSQADDYAASWPIIRQSELSTEKGRDVYMPVTHGRTSDERPAGCDADTQNLIPACTRVTGAIARRDNGVSIVRQIDEVRRAQASTRQNNMIGVIVNKKSIVICF